MAITLHVFLRGWQMTKNQRGRYNVYIYIPHFSRLARQQTWQRQHNTNSCASHLATHGVGDRWAREWFFSAVEQVVFKTCLIISIILHSTWFNFALENSLILLYLLLFVTLHQNCYDDVLWIFFSLFKVEVDK